MPGSRSSEVRRLAGIFGETLARVMEVALSFPTLLLVLVVQALLSTPTLGSLALLVGFLRWTDLSRRIREVNASALTALSDVYRRGVAEGSFRADLQVAEVDVGVAGQELPGRVAHRRAAVAAAAGLVEHQRTVLRPEAADQRRSLRGDRDPSDDVVVVVEARPEGDATTLTAGQPVTVTLIVVQSIAIFNDFTNPLYYLPGKENVTVQLTLFNFQSQFNTSFNLLFMNILLVTIPPLLVFIFFNRQIVAGMTAEAPLPELPPPPVGGPRETLRARRPNRRRAPCESRGRRFRRGWR